MKIVIIGNGITGVTAARHIRKQSNHEILLISGETEHFFSRTALMYIYMGHLRYKDTKPYEDWFWEKNRIDLLKAWVTNIDTDNKQLATDSGQAIAYDKLIIATGSVPNKFGWPGQDLEGVQGLYSYQDLELLEKNTENIERAVIVGGGLIGIELAEMLHTRHIPVTFLVRENSYWSNVLPKGESAIVNEEIRRHGFDLRLNTELDCIIDDGSGRVAGVKTTNDEEISCQLVGLTAGVRPNISLLKDTAIETDIGIVVDRAFRTNIPEVYAAGDCAQFKDPLPGRKPIEQVWYTGRMHGETLAQSICEDKPREYDPGPWFNSAKFINIEYQTYGDIPPEPDEGTGSLYWQHANGKMCVHLRYEKSSSAFKGINTLGIRYRHELFDKWLRESRDIEYVLQNLGAANFDPEFFSEYEKEVVAEYNRESGKQLQLKKRRGIRGFLELMRL